MYGIRNCDTVKKARAWLDARNVSYELHDYTIAGVGRPGAVEQLLPAERRFRKLPESRKAGLDEARAVALMVEYPSAIKRPVVEVARQLVVGFKPELYGAQKWK